MSKNWVRDWGKLKKKAMFMYGFGISLRYEEGLMGTGETGVAVIVHSNKWTLKNGKKSVESTAEEIGCGYEEKEAISAALRNIKHGKVKSRDPMKQKVYWKLAAKRKK